MKNYGFVPPQGECPNGHGMQSVTFAETDDDGGTYTTYACGCTHVDRQPANEITEEVEARILTRMQELGLRVTWEYPGMAYIVLNENDSVTTGLNGWEYGTITIMGRPLSFAAEPAGIDENTTDPHLIAEAWVNWVSGWQQHTWLQANGHL